MNSWSSPLGGSVKTATRVAMPLCTRSAASSAPAPPESGDTTIASAGATGSVTTSAHPAARRTGCRTDGTATMPAATAAKATATAIGARLGRRKLILRFISKFRVGTWKQGNRPAVVDLVKSARRRSTPRGCRLSRSRRFPHQVRRRCARSRHVDHCGAGEHLDRGASLP